MIPFYINAFLILIIDFVISSTVKDRDKQKKLICVFNTLQIVMFVALRSETTGNDTLNYVNFFKSIANNPHLALSNTLYEIGFRWYSFLIAFITNDPRVFLAITAVISIIPFGILIYRYSDNCGLSFFAFSTMEFILFSMTGMRQNVAYFFVYASFVCFISNKKQLKILAVILLILGGLFHMSAWAFSILYVISLVRSVKVKNYIYICSIIFALLFRNQIGTFIVSRFYLSYQVSETSAYSRIVIVGIVLLFNMLFYNRIEKSIENEVQDREILAFYRSSVDAIFLTTFFYIIALSVSAAAREGRYFFVFFIIQLPYFKYLIVKRQRKLFSLICVILLTLLMLYLFPRNGLCTYGYSFW